MKNKIERFLLSLLFGLTILLGLAFWLNTFFNFNLFYRGHWDKLAKLQASHMPINNNFYISIGVAVLLFVFGLFFIYRKGTKSAKPQQVYVAQPQINNIQQIQKPSINENIIQMNRPPRLNLPNNMAQIVSQQHTATGQTTKRNDNTQSTNPYTSMIGEIFSANGYLVKPNPTIKGFTPNVFAIANNEILWIGGIDCDIEKIKTSIEKLQSVFKTTLEDIPINTNGFILDTMNKYNQSSIDNIFIFKSIDELKNFITEHPAAKIEDEDKENFDSYSEYIDTIIQYIKNL